MAHPVLISVLPAIDGRGPLSAHKGAKIRAWAARNKVELCVTPTYASWTNPIEAQFGRYAPS